MKGCKPRTLDLERDGIAGRDCERGRDVDALETISVGELMQTDSFTLQGTDARANAGLRPRRAKLRQGRNTKGAKEEHEIREIRERRERREG